MRLTRSPHPYEPSATEPARRDHAQEAEEVENEVSQLAGAPAAPDDVGAAAEGDTILPEHDAEGRVEPVVHAEQQPSVAAAHQRHRANGVRRSAGADRGTAQRRGQPPERRHRRLTHPAHPRSRTVGFRRGKAFADR